ncbi:hypothetical protein ACVH8U_003184 [Yersinia enterocolitica]
MINPAEKLKAKQQEFISIRELIERISRLHPAMSQAQIANWLLIELTDARPVTPPLLIAAFLFQQSDTSTASNVNHLCLLIKITRRRRRAYKVSLFALRYPLAERLVSCGGYLIPLNLDLPPFIPQLSIEISRCG